MTKSPKTPPVAPETPALTSALTSGMAAGSPAARVWLDIMAESTRFVSERLQNDLETQTALLRCQSPADLMQLQSDFFRRAVHQYTSEALRLCEIMTKEATDIATDMAKDTSTRTRRGYDDVPV